MAARQSTRTTRNRRNRRNPTRDFNLALMQGRVAQYLATPKIEMVPAECTQKMGCPCGGCEAANAKIKAQVADERAILQAFTKSITAGQSDSNVIGDDLLTRWNASDQPILPITSRGQLMAKWTAENDDHPDSIDWQDAPAGCKDTYGLLVNKALEGFERGATIAQVTLASQAMPEAHRKWLETGNGASLIVCSLDGLVTLMGDPASEPQDSYPGAPENRWERLAGKTHNGGLVFLVAAIMSTRAGGRMTDRRRAWLLNCPQGRAALDLHEYRYVSVSAMADARRKAKELGLIKRVQEAVHYRDQHRWRLASPSVWVTLVEVPAEITETIAELIKATAKDSVQESRQRLREMAA